jgi:MFS transporter, ACS family, glucarate transporter
MTRLKLEHPSNPDGELDVGAGERPTHFRYRVLAIGCALAVVTYVLRVGFSSISPRLESLGLDSRHVGYLMGIFMVSYGLFEMPWGMIGDRLGVRNMLTMVAAGGSLTTLAIALVAYLPKETIAPLAMLLILRFLFGMFQAGTFPGLSRMIGDWVPTTERGFAQGTIWTSSRIGGSLAPLILVPFFKRFQDWSTPLVLVSSLGLVWCLAYWPWMRNRPEESPGVNPAELKHITTGRTPGRRESHSGVPWGRMLKSPNVWALCLTYGFLGYSGNFFLTNLPDYLTKYRHLPPDKVKWLQSLPFVCGVVACLLGGWLSDQIIRRTGNRRWGRRAVGVIGLSIASLSFLATIWVHDTIALGALLCLTFFGNDLSMAPAWAAATDIGERHAGTLSGAMNMMASYFGAIGAIAAGSLLHANYLVLPFYLYSGCYALAVLCWLRVDVTEPLTAPD